MLKIRVAVLSFAVLLSGCSFFGGPQAKSSPTPKAKVSAAPTAAGDAWTQAWAAVGIDLPPPQGYLGSYLQPVPGKVLNLTGGAVSDAEAQAWAAGNMREYAAQVWAVSNVRDDIFAAAVLGDPKAGANLWLLDELTAAHQSGATRIDFLPAKVTRMAVVRVPADLKAAYPPPAVMTDLALVEWLIGPAHTAITKSDGTTQTLTSLNPGAQLEFVIAGAYKAAGNPVAPLWFQQSSWNCSLHANLKDICATVPPA